MRFLLVLSLSAGATLSASNHSPLFEAYEAALPVGVRLMSSLALDFLAGPR